MYTILYYIKFEYFIFVDSYTRRMDNTTYFEYNNNI